MLRRAAFCHAKAAASGHTILLDAFSPPLMLPFSRHFILQAAIDDFHLISAPRRRERLFAAESATNYRSILLSITLLSFFASYFTTRRR